MPEVQNHGFTWEKNIIRSVYGATDQELNAIKYTSKMDLPSNLNKQNNVDLSIKTSCSANAVCMGDCLRVYDAVSSGKPIHMTVIHYRQDDATNTKKLISITEVNLTNSVILLFGTLTRQQIEELDRAVKSVPQKQSPTPEQYEAMYSIRNTLQILSSAIHLDIKCNSQQSRLQCSFNHFQDFLNTNPDRIIAKSTTGDFRGKKVIQEVASSRRTFN